MSACQNILLWHYRRGAALVLDGLRACLGIVSRALGRLIIFTWQGFELLSLPRNFGIKWNLKFQAKLSWKCSAQRGQSPLYSGLWFAWLTCTTEVGGAVSVYTWEQCKWDQPMGMVSFFPPFDIVVPLSELGPKYLGGGRVMQGRCLCLTFLVDSWGCSTEDL